MAVWIQLRWQRIGSNNKLLFLKYWIFRFYYQTVGSASWYKGPQKKEWQGNFCPWSMNKIRDLRVGKIVENYVSPPSLTWMYALILVHHWYFRYTPEVWYWCNLLGLTLSDTGIGWCGERFGHDAEHAKLSDPCGMPHKLSSSNSPVLLLTFSSEKIENISFIIRPNNQSYENVWTWWLSGKTADLYPWLGPLAYPDSGHPRFSTVLQGKCQDSTLKNEPTLFPITCFWNHHS